MAEMLTAVHTHTHQTVVQKELQQEPISEKNIKIRNEIKKKYKK